MGVRVADDAHRLGHHLVLVMLEAWSSRCSTCRALRRAGSASRSARSCAVIDPGPAPVGLLRAADRVRRAHRVAARSDHRPRPLPGCLHLRGLPLGHPERPQGPSRGRPGAGPGHRSSRSTAIALPQAIRMTLPPLASNFAQLHQVSRSRRRHLGERDHRRGMELSATSLRPLETFTSHRRTAYIFICWAAFRHGQSASGTAWLQARRCLRETRTASWRAGSRVPSTYSFRHAAAEGGRRLARTSPSDTRLTPRQADARCVEARDPRHSRRRAGRARSRASSSLIGRIRGRAS